MQIESSSTSLSVATVSTTTDNIGLIFGICIPIGILVIAAIGLVFYKINMRRESFNA